MRQTATLLLTAVLAALPHASLQAAHPAERASLTRAEAVALVLEARPIWRERVAEARRKLPALPLFSDAARDTWYAPYLEVAFKQGIIEGNPGRRFRPRDPVTIEEAIALIVRSYEKERALPLTQASATPDWYMPSFKAALRYGFSLKPPLKVGKPLPPREFQAILASSANGLAVALPASALAWQPPEVATPARKRTATTVAPRAATGGTSRPAALRPLAPARPVQGTSAVAYASAKNFAISMPSLGIRDLSVIHPSDAFSSQGLLAPLKSGVGHLFSYPGRGGKVLIYGHSSAYPWDVSPFTKIFRQINRLNVGDLVYVTFDGKVHVYQVASKQAVPARDMSAYQGGGAEQLILYTCWPPDSISQRYLVFASPVQQVAVR